MCVDLTLPRDTTAPRLARGALTTLLDAAGASELVGDAQIVVTELVTNAIRHARGLVQLHATVGETVVRIEVADESPDQLPVHTPTQEASEGGRGVAMVEALAAHWGITTRDSGKTVWVELSR